jgi:ketosteroid isomerase-like protein
MADRTALAVVQEAWEKWIAGDLEGFLALWDPSGVWTQSGHSRVSGSYHGVEEIAKMAQVVFEVSEGTLKAHPIELAAAGEESVLGYMHAEAQRPGATINQDAMQRFVVRNGKIVSLHNVFTNQDEIDAFYK